MPYWKSIQTQNLKSEYIEELIAVAEGESVILENIDTNTITIPEGPKLAQKAATLIDDKQSKLMAKALSLMNDHPSAISIWKAFIQSDKENPENWKGLAGALEYAGDLDTASKCHAKANALSNQPLTCRKLLLTKYKPRQLINLFLQKWSQPASDLLQ